MDAYIEATWGPLNLAAAGVPKTDYELEMTRIMTDGIIRYIRQKTNASMIIDKMTPVERPDVAQRIKTAFPNAKIAYLVRDGRDIAVSFLFDWLTKAHGPSGAINTDSARYQRFVGKKNIEVERLFTDQEVAEYAQNWCDAIDIFLPIASHHFSYEEMKADLGSVLRKYFDFIGIEHTNDNIRACCEGASFKVMSGGSDAGDATRVSSASRRGVARGWVDYFTRRDGEIFHSVAGETLRKCGYENDASWINELPGKLVGFQQTATK